MKRISIVFCRLVVLVMVFNLLCLGSATGQAESITIVTEEFPPFNYTNPATGTLTGFNTEIVQALLKELSIETEIRSFPWARANKMAEKQKNVLIYSLKRTAKREALFKWIGALIKHEACFLAIKDSRIKPTTTLNMMKQYRIGAIHDGAIAMGLKADKFSTIVLLPDRDIIWKHLKRGGIDLWCTNIFSARHIIASMGDNPDDVKIIHRYEKLSKDSLYMAFSIQTDDALVEKFRKGYNRLKDQGVHKNILKRYGFFREN